MDQTQPCIMCVLRTGRWMGSGPLQEEISCRGQESTKSPYMQVNSLVLELRWQAIATR